MTLDMTVVVGIDQRTARQLMVSWRTWALHRPLMWQLPWVVFHDWTSPNGLYDKDVEHLLKDVMQVPSVTFVRWPPKQPGYDTFYKSQREKMLSGFVHVPARHVESQWWMKIDTDALALDSKRPWLEDEWFEPDEEGNYNAWIASRWGYTKPANQMQILEDWADNNHSLKRWPRVGYEPPAPDAKRFSHSRMASWLSFYNTRWTKRASAYTDTPWQIPVPSQDGYHFYVSARRRDRVHRANMKRRGWTNCSKIESLQQRAKEVLE
jgi:hypothetical protein